MWKTVANRPTRSPGEVFGGNPLGGPMPPQAFFFFAGAILCGSEVVGTHVEFFFFFRSWRGDLFFFGLD